MIFVACYFGFSNKTFFSSIIKYNTLNSKYIEYNKNAFKPSSNNHYANFLSQSVQSSLNLYYSKCCGQDFVKPISEACSNPFGVSSTILESLELINLLNLKHIIQLSNQYLKNHHCDKIEIVDRHQFWTRYIGSLIGTFYLTNNFFYLKQATECALKMIKVQNNLSYPYSYVNISSSQGFNRAWQIYTPISQSISGLPELIALYKLTKNPIFEKEIERLYNSIPPLQFNSSFNKTLLYHYYNPKTSSFIQNSNLSYLIFLSNSLYFRSPPS